MSVLGDMKAFLKRFLKGLERFMHEIAIIDSWERAQIYLGMKTDPWDIKTCAKSNSPLYLYTGEGKNGQVRTRCERGASSSLEGEGPRTAFCSRGRGGTQNCLQLGAQQGGFVWVEADADDGQPGVWRGHKAWHGSCGRWGGEMDRREAEAPLPAISPCYLGIRNKHWVLERDTSA